MTSYTISGGVTSSGITLLPGDSMTVNSGGMVNSITVDSGASMTVAGGGLASNTSVDAAANSANAAELTVEQGGLISGTTVTAASGQSAQVDILPYATAVATTLSAVGSGSALLTVAGNAVVSNAVVSSGGTERWAIGSGQTLPTLVISANVDVIVAPGGSVQIGTDVMGGSLTGNSFTGLSVDQGGTVDVTANGTLDAATLRSGQIVLAAGVIANGTTVDGGTLSVVATDMLSGSIINGGVVAMSGGSATTTMIETAGTLVVDGGAVASATTVGNGGVVLVTSNGTITGTTLQNGGTIDLRGIAFTSGVSATLNAGSDVLTLSGGSTSATLQLAGGYTGDSFVASTDGAGGTNVTIASTTPTPTPTPTPSGLAVQDTSNTGASLPAAQAYSGPVSGLQEQLIYAGSDGLNVSLTTNNWFIHTGAGNDAIAVFGGTNVLDGGGGSNFLVGGTGTDTFYLDDRQATAPIWSTVVNFHAGDAATIWGVTPQDFTFTWLDGQGATGYTGLTLDATASGKPTASLTLAGFTSADLNSNKLSVSYGSVGGSSYMYVKDNG